MRANLAGNYKADMAQCQTQWFEGLIANNQHNYEGIVNEERLGNILELHKRDTVSSFGTRSSRRVANNGSVQVKLMAMTMAMTTKIFTNDNMTQG